MTKKLYIVGHPVAHSKSPVMHNAAYQALGLDWFYDFADCETCEIAEQFFDSDDWFAVNVTMPYKPGALKVADFPSAAAQLAGGANVLVRTERGIQADNTDGAGCISYLAREGVDVRNKRVVICGTGPTSLAIMHTALVNGAARVTLLGRDEQKAQRVVEDYLEQAQALGALVDGACAKLFGSAYETDAAKTALSEAGVIIDATPLGMKPGDPAPFDTTLLHAGQTVLDVVYGHGETTLAKAAREAGARFLDGRGMLVAQAVETVRDINEFAALNLDLDDYDIFTIMATAAEFSFSD